MKRFLIGIVTGLFVMLLMAVPALAGDSATFSGGTWNVGSDYDFTVQGWPGWETGVSLSQASSGQQWSATFQGDEGTWQARFGLASADQWNWDESGDSEAVVDTWDLAINYEHPVFGSLGLGFEADTDVINGEDAFGTVSLFSAGLRVGPVLDHEAQMILGTWILKAYAQAGPAIQVLDNGTNEPYTFCGLSAQWGAEVGYLLFNFIGVSAGVSQRYDLSPWGQVEGDSLSLSQQEYYIRGMIRF